MTDIETKLADALRKRVELWKGCKIERGDASAQATLKECIRQLECDLAAHDSARAQPASVADDYREIARLIGCIFFYGGFKAETRNERDLEALLRRTGNFYETEAQLLAAAPQRKE